MPGKNDKAGAAAKDQAKPAAAAEPAKGKDAAKAGGEAKPKQGGKNKG